MCVCIFGRCVRQYERGISVNFILASKTLFFDRAGLVSGILASQASWKYSAVCCSTIFAYSAYTLGVTQWRTKFRRQMIALENEASAKVCRVLRVMVPT